MAPYQERVIQEKRELDERRLRLLAFIHTARFASLSADERDRLRRQREVMDEYSGILGERIGAFATE